MASAATPHPQDAPELPHPEEAGAACPDHSAPVLHRLRPHEIPHPTLAADTDPAAEQVQLAIYRAMTPARKVQLVLESIQLSRDLALAGLRARHPSAGPDELRRRLYGQELGEELASKVYGPLSQYSSEP